MAKQKDKKKIRGWVYWIVCLVLLVIVGVVTYLVWDKYFRVDNVGPQEEVKVEQVENTQVEEESKEEAEPPKKVIQFEGGDPNEEEGLTGMITYAGVVGNLVMIRTNIDQFLGEGTCELEIMRDGAVVYTAMGNIIAGASTSSCDGFDVPFSAIGDGAAQIMIKLSSGDKTGTLTTEVNL